MASVTRKSHSFVADWRPYAESFRGTGEQTIPQMQISTWKHLIASKSLRISTQILTSRAKCGYNHQGGELQSSKHFFGPPIFIFQDLSRRPAKYQHIYHHRAVAQTRARVRARSTVSEALA